MVRESIQCFGHQQDAHAFSVTSISNASLGHQQLGFRQKRERERAKNSTSWAHHSHSRPADHHHQGSDTAQQKRQRDTHWVKQKFQRFRMSDSSFCPRNLSAPRSPRPIYSLHISDISTSPSLGPCPHMLPVLLSRPPKPSRAVTVAFPESWGATEHALLLVPLDTCVCFLRLDCVTVIRSR
jgi:hypothetical protein